MMSYDEAIQELQQIIQDLETGNVKMEELSEKVSKAKELLSLCRAKLRGVETEINSLNQSSRIIE